MSFPNDFLWGVSTSAFQIEGDIQNDFTEWERLGLFKKSDKEILYNNGIDHWKNWRNDFEFIKQTGANSYRFSIEWARIFPEPDKIDYSAILQYEQMIDFLLENNIEPMLTLHHFSNPIWLHEISPWNESSVIQSFCKFSRLIVDKFIDKINLWVTFNEPVVWALAAYGAGKFPPAKAKLSQTMEVLYNMMQAHVCVYDYIKAKRPEAQVGIAKHFIVFKESNTFSLFDKGLVNRVNTYFNKIFLEAFKKNELSFQFPPLISYKKKIELNDKIDFWGINYYYRLHVKFRFSIKSPIYIYFKKQQTDMGWEIYSKGLKEIIRLVKSTEKDIYITENGIATQDDILRTKYIYDHVKVVKKELSIGAKIKGYFYWSLFDNYEWLEGKEKRFGLVFVDYKNGNLRKLKPSGKDYKRIIDIVTKM